MNMNQKTNKQTFKFKNKPLQTAIKQTLINYKKVVSTVFGIGLSSFVLSGCVTNQVTTSNSEPTLLPKTTVNEATVTKSSASAPKIHAISKTADITPDKLNLNLATQVQYYPNIWDEMSHHFDLADQDYGKYDEFLTFYGQRKTHLKRVSERAKPYLYYILNEVKKRNMPYEIALLPAVESGFKAVARSNQSAVGLWQFIPSTGDTFNLHRNWWYDGRKDVVQSTSAALDYLQELYASNNNDWLLALASYNAGLGSVYRAQRAYRKAHKNEPNIADYQPNFWEIQQYLPKETQGYVPKLLAVAHIVENPEKFKTTIEPIDNKPFFKIFTLKKQVSLHEVASISSTPSKTFQKLNPGYHQPATPPNGVHHILLPIAKSAKFAELLQTNSRLFKVHWQKHKIKPGDSLSVIAYKFKTSSKAIQRLNGMKNSKIRAGKTLLIPIPEIQSNYALASNNDVKTSSKNVSYSKPIRHPVVIAKVSSSSSKKIHTVKSGDSLWTIAKKYNTTIKQLAKWNNLSTKSYLKMGQKLAILTPQSKAKSSLQASSNVKIEHVLKSGESLWILAKRYDVKTAQIAKWNRIPTHKVLQPGMKLTIWGKAPKTIATKYIVKDGDNLWNIAKANQISTNDLAEFNKLSPKALLQPGQILHIPLSKEA